MGKIYIPSTQCPALNSHVCDVCGETALVLDGDSPAGWHEDFKFDFVSMVASETGQLYCPVWRVHEEERR